MAPIKILEISGLLGLVFLETAAAQGRTAVESSQAGGREKLVYVLLLPIRAILPTYTKQKRSTTTGQTNQFPEQATSCFLLVIATHTNSKSRYFWSAESFPTVSPAETHRLVRGRTKYVPLLPSSPSIPDGPLFGPCLPFSWSLVSRPATTPATCTSFEDIHFQDSSILSRVPKVNGLRQPLAAVSRPLRGKLSPHTGTVEPYHTLDKTNSRDRPRVAFCGPIPRVLGAHTSRLLPPRQHFLSGGPQPAAEGPLWTLSPSPGLSQCLCGLPSRKRNVSRRKDCCFYTRGVWASPDLCHRLHSLEDRHTAIPHINSYPQGGIRFFDHQHARPIAVTL